MLTNRVGSLQWGLRMSGFEIGAETACTACGALGAGNFCQSCGMPRKAGVQPGWSGVVAEAAGIGERFGTFQVFQQMLRAPVTATLRLTDDESYKGHLSFFLTMLGAKLFLVLGLAPHIVRLISGKPGIDSGMAIARENILQILSLLIFLPIGYYLYRFAAKADRTQRSYYRFSLLGSGFIFAIDALTYVAVVISGTLV